MPAGITPQDLSYRLYTDPSGMDFLQLNYGNSNVLIAFQPPPVLDDLAAGYVDELFSPITTPAQLGVDLVKFSDGTVLTLDQLMQVANPLPNNADPIVTGLTTDVSAGQSIAASQLFDASDTAGNTITWYQISNTDTGGGYFELNGQAEPVGQSFMVNAAQLSSLEYVGGTAGTSDSIQVSGFDGLYMSYAATSTVNVTTSNVFEASGTDQIVTGSTSGPDTLIGGYGGDTLTGASGQDTFDYASGSGTEVISETAPVTASSDNVLALGAGITPSSLTLSAAGVGELVLSTGGSGNSVSIEGFDPLNPLQSFPIQSFEFTNGTNLTLFQLLGDSAVTGTSGSIDNSDGSITSYDFTPSGEEIYSAKNVNSSGQVTASVLINAAGAELVSSYVYNSDGTHTEMVVSTPAGGSAATATTTTYDYSASGVKTGEQVQGPNGTSATYTFNAAGKVVAEDSTAADGTTTDTTYNAQGQPLTVDATSASGATSDTTYTYNADGSYTEVFVSTPAGGSAATATTTTYDYSASGVKTGEQVQGPNGTSATYTFNAAGKVVAEDSTAADGTTTDTTYNAQGQPLTVDATSASGATNDSTFAYNADGTHTDTVVATPAGGGSTTTTVYDYSASGSLSNENAYTLDSDGSYTDTWSETGGGHGTYWWNASTSEYLDTWYDSNGSSWTDEYQYATGGSPGAAGYSFVETYNASDGDQGTRQYDATTGTVSLTWDSTATGQLSGATTDSGFIGLQNQGELTNTQKDLTFFNPNASPSFEAFLAGGH